MKVLNPEDFVLDKKSKIKLYKQLYDCVTELIDSDSVPLKTKLPSVRDMSATLKISKNTVTKAYSILESEGYIYSLPKSGFYTSKPGLNPESVPQKEESPQDEIPTVDSIFKEFNTVNEEDKHIKLDSFEPVLQSAPITEPQKSKETENSAKKLQSVPFKQQSESPIMFSSGQTIKNKITVIDDSKSPLISSFKQVLEQYNNFVHYENEMSGIPEFRVAIASFLYKYFNIDANPSQIIVGSDPMQLFANLLSLPSICNSTPKTEKIGLLKLAEEVSQKNSPYIQRVAAVEETASQNIRNIITRAGIKLSEVPLGTKDFMFQSLLTTGANLAVLNSENFTLRGGIEEKPFLDFLEWADKEKYRYIIEFDSLTVNTSSLPLKQFDKNDKIIYIRTFKSFSPLSSASFVILPKNLADEYKEAFKDFNCPLSYLEQTVLIDFIISGKLYNYLEKIKNL